jgi:uncharacterized membrane protein YphA (DoxX/SURF4 family)
MNSYLLWALRIIPAVILLQTLFFKFTGAPESVWIFTQLGVEPWGRYLSGALELLAAVLILWPRTTPFGAVLACGLMVGAILSHFTKLGIVVQNDGGLLFGLAIVTLACSAVLAWNGKDVLLNLVK